MALVGRMLGNYHEVLGRSVAQGDGANDDGTTDFFIGRFDDGKYHLLGFRPSDARAYFSTASESQGDHGIVTLPEGRENLRNCQTGDLLTVTPNTPQGKPYRIEYLSHRGELARR